MKELYCDKQSVIHNINPRVKLIFTLVLLIAISLTPTGAWAVGILFLAIVLSLIILSRIGFEKVFLRSLISIPFVFAAIPLVFTGSEPFRIFQAFDSMQIRVSEPGFIQFVSIAIKSWVSLLAAILLTSATRYTDLITSFRKLGVPKILVAIFALMWRYLSLLIDEAQHLMQARSSRSTEKRSRRGSMLYGIWQAQVTGKMAGNLLLRSIERSDRVYSAMCSRGYDGNPISLDEKPLSKKEILILLLGVIIILLVSLTGTLFYA